MGLKEGPNDWLLYRASRKGAWAVEGLGAEEHSKQVLSYDADKDNILLVVQLSYPQSLLPMGRPLPWQDGVIR
jgi:hypothetical protein